MAQQRPRDVNMADVAARAGVSIASVSRALRGSAGVGAATRTRILEAAADLSYVVSPEASRLAGGPTGRIALVVPKVEPWFYARTLAVLELELRSAGHDVLLYVLDGPAERERFFRELPTRRKVDAVVVIALPVLDQEARRLSHLGVHVVVVGTELLDHPHVRVDDHEIARLATCHLVALGHREIAMIRLEDTQGTYWSPDAERVRGYRDALVEAGLDPDRHPSATVPFGPLAGAEAMEGLLRRRRRPTAVLAYSDEMAIGALRVLDRRGIGVPEEMSVVGIDDHPLAELFDLTTVRQDVDGQARQAARMTLRLMDGEPVPHAHLVLPHGLVERGTTAPPAQSRALAST